MMMCPQCGRVYADDLMYCLQDGSALSPEPPTIAEEEPTVVRAPRRTGPAVASTIPPRRSAGWLKWAVPATLLLILAVVAAVAAILFLRPMLKPSSNDQAAAPANARPSPQPPSENRPPPFPSPTPTATRTEPPARNENRPENLNSDEPANRDDNDGTGERFTDPGPTRISFRRGAEGETVTGRIAQERSFVLYTMAGQRLNARVQSADDCVEFADGGTSTSFSTRQGDSRVTVVNNCDRPARFNLSVTVR